MATFSGGEEITGVIRISSTINTAPGAGPAYTVPAGKYLEIQTYIGAGSSGNINIRLTPPSGVAVNQTYTQPSVINARATTDLPSFLTEGYTISLSGSANNSEYTMIGKLFNLP